MRETQSGDGTSGVRIDKRVSVREEEPLTAVELVLKNDRPVPIAVLIEHPLPTALAPGDVGFQRKEHDHWRVIGDRGILYSAYLHADDEESAVFLVRRGYDVARQLAGKPEVVAVRPAPDDFDERSDEIPAWNRELLEETGSDPHEDELDLVTDGGEEPEEFPDEGERNANGTENADGVVDADATLDDLFEEVPAPEDRPHSLSSNVREILDRSSEMAADGGDDPPASPSFELDLGDQPEGEDQSGPPTESSEDETPSTGSRDSRSIDSSSEGQPAGAPAETAQDRSGDVPRQLEARVERLESEFAALDAYKDALGDFLDGRGTGREMLDTLQDRLATLEENLAGVEETIDRIEVDREGGRERLDDLEGMVTSVTADVDEVQRSVSDVATDVRTLSDDFADVDDRVDRLADQLDGVTERVGDFDDRLAAVESAVDSIYRVKLTQKRILKGFEALSTAGSQLDDSLPERSEATGDGGRPANQDPESDL